LLHLKGLAPDYKSIGIYPDSVNARAIVGAFLVKIGKLLLTVIEKDILLGSEKLFPSLYIKGARALGHVEDDLVIGSENLHINVLSARLGHFIVCQRKRNLQFFQLTVSELVGPFPSS